VEMLCSVSETDSFKHNTINYNIYVKRTTYHCSNTTIDFGQVELLLSLSTVKS